MPAFIILMWDFKEDVCCYGVCYDLKVNVLGVNSVFRNGIRPASEESPPSGPRGIGSAAIEKETSRSRLWSLSLSSGIFSSSNVSMTNGGC